MKALNLIVVMAALAFGPCDNDTAEACMPVPVPPPVRIALHLQHKQKKFTAPFFMQGQYDVPSLPWNGKADSLYWAGLETQLCSSQSGMLTTWLLGNKPSQ